MGINNLWMLEDKEDDDREVQETKARIEEKEIYLNKIKGSLFGGAIGDALGYPVEFLNEDEIFGRYGEGGITEYRFGAGGKALISDDTQMTLYTANGMLVGETRLYMRGIDGIPHHYIWDSYKDWLYTQSTSIQDFDKIRANNYYCTSWLNDVSKLYSNRAPGNTCITAIRQGEPGGVAKPINNSKGCGGIMRVAPIALHYASVDIEELDKESAEIAALTHGHSLGYMPAAALSHILSLLVYGEEGRTLKDIVFEAKETVARIYAKDEHIGELTDLMDRAVEFAENDKSDVENIHNLGKGWVAEETLAIAIYCSLKYQNDFSKGIITAVNHNGDSDSTGAVTGNILGAVLGFDSIEDKWKDNLELYDVIDEMAMDICHGCPITEYGHYRDPEWISKYIEMRWPKRNAES